MIVSLRTWGMPVIPNYRRGCYMEVVLALMHMIEKGHVKNFGKKFGGEKNYVVLWGGLGGAM